MDSPNEVQDSYRVEVSGWDISENFFVEKTLLDWRGEEQKEIRLRTPVRKGCVLFVRLMQPTSLISNMPIAYQVMELLEAKSERRFRVSLAKLRPRTRAEDDSWNASTMKETA